jgi:hypothetical protein
MSVDHWLGSRKGPGPAETMHVWIASLADLRGRDWWNGDCAGLRHSQVEILCVWITGLTGLRGSAWQRLCGSEGWELGGA